MSGGMTENGTFQDDAGRELDERVAIEALGWRRDEVNVGRWIPAGKRPYPPGYFYTSRPGNYSTFIAAAWEVVERMRALGFLLSLYQSEDGWGAMFCPDAKPDDGGWDGEGETAPLAICRAALATLADTATPSEKGPAVPAPRTSGNEGGGE